MSNICMSKTSDFNFLTLCSFEYNMYFAFFDCYTLYSWGPPQGGPWPPKESIGGQ